MSNQKAVKSVGNVLDKWDVTHRMILFCVGYTDGNSHFETFACCKKSSLTKAQWEREKRECEQFRAGYIAALEMAGLLKPNQSLDNQAEKS